MIFWSVYFVLWSCVLLVNLHAACIPFLEAWLSFVCVSSYTGGMDKCILDDPNTNQT